VVEVEVVLNFYVKNKRRNTIKRSGEIFSPLLTYNNVYERERL